MSLASFVQVNITASTRTPSRQGFGTPLILAYHTAWVDRVRTYENLDDMAADGFTSTGVGAGAYWAASAVFAQNPKVTQIKIGRRTNAFTQKVQLIVTTAVAGTVYKFSIAPLGGSATTFTRTVPGSSTIAAEAAAIKTLIDAAGFAMTTAVVTSDRIECTASVAGTMFVYSGRNVELQIFESTAAPAGISTDLDSVVAADDDWYGLTLDSVSKAEALIVAAWTESKIKVFFASNGDTENGSIGVSSTLLKQLQAADYFRTSTWTDSAVLPSFLGAGVMGEEFPYDPGLQAQNYNGKSIRSVTVDNISSTFEGEVVLRGGNVYTSIKALNVTRPGVMASGEFIDITTGKDWLTARLQEANFGVIAGTRRVPYTDAGIHAFVTATTGVLQRAQGTVQNPGFLDPEVAVTVTAKAVKDVDPADKATRVYRDLAFSAKIAGAVHQIIINGNITV